MASGAERRYKGGLARARAALERRPMTLLSLENVRRTLDDRVLLAGVSLAIGEGERVGLLGRNGAGKSTLLRICAGVEEPDEGQRVVRRGARIGWLEQDPVLAPEVSAREIVRAGLGERAAVLADLERVHAALASASEERLGSLLAEEARLGEALERLGGHDVEHRIEATLHALGIERFDARCGTLSGGERRRVALARLLLGDPDLLLLDEPTNHLDAFVTDWLEDWFLETRKPLLLVTHDRYFLDRVVDRIVELDRGELTAYEGGYGEYLEARAERLESERRAESSRQNLLRRETEWMRRGPPARTTKAKARIRRYHGLVDAAPQPPPRDLELFLPPGPRLGARVLALSGVSKRFGEQLVLPRLDLELAAGERLGIVGPNGAGKTTLLRVLLGTLQPDTGARECGETVRFTVIDQARAALDPAQTVGELLAGRGDMVKVGKHAVRVESFLERAGFPPGTRTTLVGELSGGEQNRLLLSQRLAAAGNVLVLDEPTNDLDLATLRALEEALVAFEGSVVVVSHDRWFLDRVATRVLLLDGHGGARLFHTDVSSVLAELARERRARAAARTERRAANDARPAAPPPRPRRITPWQERELAELEAAIPEVEAKLAALDAQLADPSLYAGPGEAVQAVVDERTGLEAELARLYARWEELESLRA